jgi:hypothetical protein
MKRGLAHSNFIPRMREAFCSGSIREGARGEGNSYFEGIMNIYALISEEVKISSG